MYEQYVNWRKNYINWRMGSANGAHGEATMSSQAQLSAWRDGYRQWRRGALKGAKGEAGTIDSSHRFPSKDASVFYDVTADEEGRPVLVPIDGPAEAGVRIDEFPPDALVTIRVFRFFEHRNDEKEIWEMELRNLNSGSLLWLPVHLTPGLHSMSGAKYGTWFTIHYLQVYVKHFSSAYHMSNEGFSTAKSFGSALETSVVKGHPLEHGYFWFVSPTASEASRSQQEQLKSWGWKHLAREGPYDGATFVKEWQKRKSPMAAQDLQAVLDEVCC